MTTTTVLNDTIMTTVRDYVRDRLSFVLRHTRYLVRNKPGSNVACEVYGSANGFDLQVYARIYTTLVYDATAIRCEIASGYQSGYQDSVYRTTTVALDDPECLAQLVQYCATFLSQSGYK
jgi:hypothetical protein